MTTAAPAKSNIIVLTDFFCAGKTASQKMAALKGLTDTDKAQLTQGIRDGSLTY